MPTYNSERTVVESIQSVLAQTYKNWELIIVDDRSSDKTWEVVTGFAGQYDNIHAYQNEKKQGAGASRNVAIEKAKGRFI
ncbi:glycosyltransferase family 2 protein, partial [Vibrio jasicida]|uniref:glycosyltransferase family 2 protein n=1 Tax=Vibrio jasicida TaxID=766224 RepID=UPI0040692376